MKKIILSLLAITIATTTAIASEKSKERALFANLKVQPGTETQFAEAAKKVITESRKEPGNLEYILQRSVSDPQQFVFYELFKSDGDLELHKRSKHVLAFLEQIKSILLPGQFTLIKYDHVDSK